eukprot:NODE_2441_length_1117_cov_7.182584_g2027_i0.p3 GENE.NODE_2441_length_1117_cov_7.182584_g2027_i0~~NODE_2441_length_1117_cov_7.182584_g2027_i0.p3  ORF type:complete len:108 (+),score=17.68 NODE_2441_length_1117_cov_7.182584_g2027_i0:341-664(+)
MSDGAVGNLVPLFHQGQEEAKELLQQERTVREVWENLERKEEEVHFEVESKVEVACISAWVLAKARAQKSGRWRGLQKNVGPQPQEEALLPRRPSSEIDIEGSHQQA